MASRGLASTPAMFLFEVIATLCLVSVVIGTATHHRSMGPAAALSSAGVVAWVSLFARPISGASMNPARSLCPALVSGALDRVWIYLTAPFVGASLAVVVLALLHARRHEEEREASEGESK
jgi:glycerol uptake facilitator-like aquaporin